MVFLRSKTKIPHPASHFIHLRRGGLGIGGIQCSDFMGQRLKLTGTVLIILIVIALVGCGIGKEKVLILKYGQGQEEHRIAVPDGVFTLSFIHSVHHTPVHEVYQIRDDNTLVLKELRYRSLGVGMPYDYENGTLEIADGEFVLKFDREFESINMIVSPIPEHTITIGEDTYLLFELTEPESPLEIKAVDKWSFKWLRLGRKGA
ncbi:MAG: DUF1850 domain-containing protein [Bacillota bacterium]